MENEEIVKLLEEIKEMLAPISSQYQDAYRKEKFDILKSVLTPINARVFPLLFDPRRLNQGEIAFEASTSQPTVSRFIRVLLKLVLIDEQKDTSGTFYYVDKFNLIDFLEKNND